MTGIPNNEIIWLQRTSKDGTLYYITSKALRDTYYIYEIILNLNQLKNEDHSSSSI